MTPAPVALDAGSDSRYPLISEIQWGSSIDCAYDLPSFD
jgi:hypothetical protein